MAQVFNNAFRDLGGEVLGAEGWDKNAPDYTSLMTKIADMGPDIIYLGATVENNTSKVVLDLRSLMPVDQVTCLLPDGLITSAFIEGAGDAAEGSFVTFAGFPPAELKGPGVTGGSDRSGTSALIQIANGRDSADGVQP